MIPILNINQANVAKLGWPVAWRLDYSSHINHSNIIGLDVIHSWHGAGVGGFTLRELIESQLATGCFANIKTKSQDGFAERTNGQLGDERGAPTSIMTKEGYSENHQLILYKNDLGTFVVPNSGYRVTRRVLKITPTIFNFKIIVEGASVTIQGFQTNAGIGRVVAEFQVQFPHNSTVPIITQR